MAPSVTDDAETDEGSEASVLGWLLLPSGDAVPITGFAPEALSASARAVVCQGGEVRGPDDVLDELVWALGFDGGFAGYLSDGWPRLQTIRQESGATTRVDMFDTPLNTIYFRLDRRDLADRIFFGPSPGPSRVFTGHGHDWSRWDRLRRQTVAWRPEAYAYEPLDLDDAVDWVHRHCDHLITAFSFVGDLLVEPAHPDSHPLQTYFRRDTAMSLRQQTYDRARKVTAVFRWCIERLPGGWVDVVRVTESLALLVGGDGGFEIVWRDFRQGRPPALEAHWRSGLASQDLPASSRAELDFARWYGTRAGVWEQLESHQAEMLHYASGGGSGHDYPGTRVIRERLLRARGEYGPPCARVVIPARVDGFLPVRMPDQRVILASELVSISAFRAFSEASGYGSRRRGEPLGPANDADDPASPVAVTRSDALAYLAWSERTTGLPLRLMTHAEHRALRPMGDRAQAFDGEMGELGPPKRPGEALERSTPGHERREWPPAVKWRDPMPWKAYGGLRFIDARDAFEWCLDGRILGRYWEGAIGEQSWGGYKCIKVCFRVVVDGTPGG